MNKQKATLCSMILLNIFLLFFPVVSSAANLDTTTKSYQSIEKLLPLYLKADWWQEYENMPQDKLISRLEKLKNNLRKITAPDRAREDVRSIISLLDLYLKKRETPAAPIAEKDLAGKSYTVYDIIAIKKNIDILGSRLSLKYDAQEEQERRIATLKERPARLKKTYLTQRQKTTKKLLLGLEQIKTEVMLAIAILDKKIIQNRIDALLQTGELAVKEIGYANKHIHITPARLEEARKKIVELEKKITRIRQEPYPPVPLRHDADQRNGTIHDALNSLGLLKREGELNALVAAQCFEQALVAIGQLQSDAPKAGFGKLYRTYTTLTEKVDRIKEWIDDTEDRIADEKELFDQQYQMMHHTKILDRVAQQHAVLLTETLSVSKTLEKNVERAEIALNMLDQKLIAHSTRFQMLKEKIAGSLHSTFVSLLLRMDDILFEINGVPITGWGILWFVLTVLLGWYLSRVPAFYILRVSPGRNRDGLKSSRESIVRIFRVIVFGLIFLMALSQLGIDITKLTILISALSIGVGFGLQTMISNFISGIILIFEKSIRIGDQIELSNGTRGVVKEINIRSTIVNTFDNIDIIVPNSEFINTKVINWTLKNKIIRLKFPFGVAYGSDVATVQDAILQKVLTLPYTLDVGEEYVPQVWLAGFGENSLDFELVVWIKPEYLKHLGEVKSEYYRIVLDTLGENGLAIPFPQREVRILHSDGGIRDESSKESEI